MKRNKWLLLPVAGILLFTILYVVATNFYPGGSQVDTNSTGFSWINNYWCNLLNEHAINGQYNPAKPIAMTGMFFLCLGLALFWYLFPLQMRMRKIARFIIQNSGALAMIIAFFLFTNIDHDLITNVASMFGLIATIGTFSGLYKNKWFGLFVFGALNLLLVVVNSYVYYHSDLLVYLPVIQKISFLSFLVWVCCININLYKISGGRQ